MTTTIFTVIAVLLCFILVAVVLLQKSKGGGLVASAQSSNQILGAPKTANFLEKMTWWLMGIIAVLCIICTIAIKNGGSSSSSALEGVEAPTSSMTVPESVVDEAAENVNE